MEKPVPYQSLMVKDGWEKMKSWEALRGENGWRLVGECPACHHTTSKLIPHSATIMALTEVDAQDLPEQMRDGPEDYAVQCHCDQRHPETPGGESGCGAYWGVRIEFQAAGGGELPVAVGAAPVAPDVVRWEKKAEELEFEALTKVRGAAEKWAVTLGALLGLVGTILLVKGPDEIAELGKGPQAAIAVLLGIAFALAVGATILTALAAQGTPKNLDLPNGEKLRKEERLSVESAKGKLLLSRGITLAAVVLIAAAVVVAWAGDPAPSSGSTVLLTPAGGQPTCGKLVTGEGGLELEVGEKSEAVPPGPYDQVVPVEGCPQK